MHACEDPEDNEIRVRPGARKADVIHLDRAPSGHLLVPCTADSKLPHHKKHVMFKEAELKS
eukprot:2079891-Prorocentrum_lima.AAC.1